MQGLLTAQFRRIETQARSAFRCVVDGLSVHCLDGDTVLTAILTHRRHVRPFEFAKAVRSGFCLMGACQDCWVRLASGVPIQACTTLVRPDMDIVTALGDRVCDHSGPGHV